MRTRHRITIVLFLAVATAALFASLAPAATRVPREYYAVSVVVPAPLSAEMEHVWRITPKSEYKVVRKKRILALWSNTSFGGTTVTVKKAISMTADRDFPEAATVIDRPLTTAEAKTLRSRALYVDADVLIVSPQNPLCTAGVTADVARRISSGEITDYAAAGFTADQWASGMLPTMIVAAPTASRSPAQTHFGAPITGTTVYRVAEANMAARVLEYEGNIAIARWSGIRTTVATSGACIVPIDGVTPSDDTVRSHSYAPSWTAYWVTKKTVDATSLRHRIAFEAHLFGARGDKYLASGTKRALLRP